MVSKKKPPGCERWRSFSGCLGANLVQSLRQRLGKAKIVKPESVGAVHFDLFQAEFKHESGSLGKHRAPRAPAPGENHFQSASAQAIGERDSAAE